MNSDTRVKVGIPAEWLADADDMDVTKVEYVRRMVRAGRRQWGYDHVTEPEQKGLRHDNSSSDVELEKGLQTAILRNLSTTDGVREDELAELLFEDLIDEIGIHLQNLKDDGKADYNPRDGGWIKTGGE